MNTTKKRIGWADICKGLLITLLIFSHLFWVSKSKYGIQNQVIDSVGIICSIWNCFFMSCFIMVSGMFSNFNKPAKAFIIGNFKALIVPAWVSMVLFNLPHITNLDYISFFNRAFLYGGGKWFLTALFLSKILLYICVKGEIKKWIVLAILLFISFLGKLLDDLDAFPNYWYHRNFMNFAFFLGIGYYFKDFIQKNVVGIVSALAFTITIVILFAMRISVPNVVSIFNESFAQHPLTLWLSIMGSITCIHLCKLIKNNVILEFLGKNSLIVYIYHMYFLSYCISALCPSLYNGTLVNSLVIVFMVITSTLVICSGIATVMEMKLFRWMKGVF